MLPPGKRRKVCSCQPSKTRGHGAVSYRIQVRQGLCNVDPQPILSVLVGRREQTDEVEVQCTASNRVHVEGDREGIVAAWSITLGHNLELMFCPLVLDGFGRNLDRAENLIGQVGLQRRSEGAVVGALDPEGPRVLLLADRDPPVPVVLEADSARAVASGRDPQRCRQGLGERGVEELDAEVGAIDREVMCRGDRKLRAVLERAVLDELGVDAPVPGVVDVLSESVSVSSITQPPCARGNHLMQEAVSIRMSELPGHIASRGLDKDVDSNCRRNTGSSGQSPLQERHFATRIEV